MPLSRDASGCPSRSAVPASRTSPASGTTPPPSTFTSVDLPAPFSPTSAWISPARTSKSTASSARTPGYDFDSPADVSSASSANAQPDLALEILFVEERRFLRRPRVVGHGVELDHDPAAKLHVSQCRERALHVDSAAAQLHEPVRRTGF